MRGYHTNLALNDAINWVKRQDMVMVDIAKTSDSMPHASLLASLEQ
jgi:hypothetical protein